jgi:hypothetical protein
LVAAACLPEAPPPWQVDHTITAALRVEVAARGPWGSPTRATDRLVAEAMPGDTIRMAPFVISPDGPVDVGSIAPRYFYCQPQSCLGAVAMVDGVRDCEAGEPVPPASPCEIRGGQLELGDLTALLQQSAVLMVAGSPDGVSTKRCMARLRGLEDSESLQDCMITLQLLQFGPTWRLLLLAAYSGLADAVPLAGITAAVTAAEPDLFPGEPPIAVRVSDPDTETVAERGEAVTVRPGALVEMTALAVPDDAQSYWFIDSIGEFSLANEALTAGWLFSAPVEWIQPDLLSATWTAPDVPGTVWVFVLLGDGSTVTPTWLRFEVEAP